VAPRGHGKGIGKQESLAVCVQEHMQTVNEQDTLLNLNCCLEKCATVTRYDKRSCAEVLVWIAD
jgi:hypothetical protein